MNIRSEVPEGESGPWSVERFEVCEGDSSLFIFNLRNPGRAMRPGTYTRLKRQGHVIMSDTDAEVRDLYPLRWHAKGDVLINGLGLGVAVQLVLGLDGVTEVTVVEKSDDVIGLVAPTFTDKRLQIVHADAFDWQPPRGKRYSAVWHDIWDDICADNLPEMHKLHRKYGRRTDWQGSWCRDQCEWGNRR